MARNRKSRQLNTAYYTSSEYNSILRVPPPVATGLAQTRITPSKLGPKKGVKIYGDQPGVATPRP